MLIKPAVTITGGVDADLLVDRSRIECLRIITFKGDMVIFRLFFLLMLVLNTGWPF